MENNLKDAIDQAIIAKYDNTVVGAYLPTLDVYLCLDKECAELYIGEKRALLRKDATDEGRFITCICCMATLDKEGENLYNERGYEIGRLSPMLDERTRQDIQDAGRGHLLR